MNTIGERVEFLRKHEGLSYNDLARNLESITADGIRKAIVNDRVKAYHINMLHDKLGWDCSFILTGEYSEKKDKEVDKSLIRPDEVVLNKKIAFEVNIQMAELQKQIVELRGDLTKLMFHLISK
ncbi:hypothetical protein [Formosa sp. PL04]|uniref:hypothetical protein n=1 Tax=Formosa sp. PL04 TaxID=3081755 RepID=UPI0029811505|nr:hypothetical protein [Formosa sp. PL04]MDW5288707.1 hypothetical protein [Formosa sp. PL04]